MKKIIILTMFVALAAGAATAEVDWQKVCARELGIDLTAPREDWEPPALSVLATAPSRDWVGVAAFADYNIHFFIAKPGGKIVFQSNPIETYAFSPADIKTELTAMDLGGKPAFTVRYESFSGGSGMGQTDVHWELFDRGQRGVFASLLTLDSFTEMVYSRWYGGDNITAWQSGGSNGQRFSTEFIPQKGQYPLLLVRYEEFSIGDMHPPEQGSEEITDVWYQLYGYDREEGDYSQITDVTDLSFDLIDPGINRLVIARIMEDDGDYGMAYQTYQEMAESANEDVAKAALVNSKRLAPSAPYNFDDLKLFKAQDYTTLREKYPQSPLTARAIMMGENQSSEDLLGVMRDFPGTPDAEGAAFVILYNGIGSATLADRANADKAMDYLKSHITVPGQLAYYYALYGDSLFGMAVDDTMNPNAIADALAAYDAGMKADPGGMFAGYMRFAHARALAASGDLKHALTEMLSYMREMPDDWWTGNGWEWLGERVVGARDGEPSLGGGEVAEMGSGQPVVLAALMLGDDNKYWTAIYTVQGDELVEQLRLEGTLYESWNADVMGKGSNDLFFRHTAENDHLFLLGMSGGKVKQVLDADLGSSYGKKPDVTVDAGSYPANITVKHEGGDLHYTYNKAKGIYEAQ